MAHDRTKPWPTAIFIVACGIATGRKRDCHGLAEGHIHLGFDAEYGFQPNAADNNYSWGGIR
jgi:hypothetical protein